HRAAGVSKDVGPGRHRVDCDREWNLADGDTLCRPRGAVYDRDAGAVFVDDVDLVGTAVGGDDRGVLAGGHGADGVGGAINYGGVSAAVVRRVDLIGGGIDYDAARTLSYPDRGRLVGGPIDDRDAVAEVVSDVDPVGRRIHRDAIAVTAGAHGRGNG